MIHIIAGKYKGRKFTEGNIPGVRPTLARVKKSVMQILEPFEGKTVLDLFSGVGTLGIEALSRGADKVTFVEKDFRAVQYLKKNLLTICSSEQFSIIKMDVHRYLKRNRDQFDIIIADPPYSQVDFQALLDDVKPMLNSNGIFCMEMRKTKIEGKEFRIKLYGRTQVVFWESGS